VFPDLPQTAASNPGRLIWCFDCQLHSKRCLKTRMLCHIKDILASISLALETALATLDWDSFAKIISFSKFSTAVIVAANLASNCFLLCSIVVAACCASTSFSARILIRSFSASMKFCLLSYAPLSNRKLKSFSIRMVDNTLTG
jgi:hypothetical protein